MYKLALLCVLLLASVNPGFASSPEEILDKYAGHIQAAEFDQIPVLFDSDSRKDIKKLMEKALKAEIKAGRSRLQLTFTGKHIKSSEVRSITAETYIARLLRDIVSSTENQGFSFDKYKVLGTINEAPDLAHVMIRLYMEGKESGFDNIQIYSFRRAKDGWGMLIPQTLKQVLLVVEMNSEQ